MGMFLTYHKDEQHGKYWIGKFYNDDDYLVVSITAPPLEKSKSFKAEADVDLILHGDSKTEAEGKLLLYFKKESASSYLQYGDRILIHKKLERIKNMGNPGGFNYQQYCAFRQIYYTAYLKKNEWILLTGKKINWLTSFLLQARKNILSILQRNMASDDQLSIAEALLIGYTEDLDRDLVKAYTNTGVVHIIAISGMHLGLIYMLLLWIFDKIPFLRKVRILKILFLLSGLWLFALLTGGCPSILRSAVMFTCIVIGENYSKRSSIYNSLAASAFILLCYNPYYLWDVGFQLSYLSLYGIVIFHKYIYHLFYAKNKWINKLWDLSAVSIAAQVLTFPICLYYFHQLPLFFLFTNLIAVPLSTLILFVEIVFISVGWIPMAAFYLGKITWLLILFMNKIIQFFNHLPYSLWENISISVTSTILLYTVVLSCGYSLLHKNKMAFTQSFIMAAIYSMVIMFTIWTLAHQKKIIVYNVAQHQAIDFIKGNRYAFIGDSIMEQEGMLQNFNVKPARIELKVNKPLGKLFFQNHFYIFEDKKILLIDSSIYFQPLAKKIDVDLIIFSHNPKVTIQSLTENFNCNNFVLDASNNLWKIGKWKTECEGLHLRCHSVSEDGAYIIDF